MSKHLTTNEFEQIIGQGPQSLVSNRFLHFENCSQCKNEYEHQLSADKVLKQLKPVSTPKMISEKVIQTVERITHNNMPKKKTDWVFLMAVITLFSIGAWIMFSGKIAQYLPKNVTQIVTGQKQEIQKNTYFDEIKDKVPAIDFSFKLPVLKNSTLMAMLGIIAALFYYMLDRKLSRFYRFKKT